MVRNPAEVRSAMVVHEEEVHRFSGVEDDGSKGSNDETTRSHLASAEEDKRGVGASPFSLRRRTDV